ncbi:hypothetical protein PAXRUDRAFT_164836, partial [Paxillus rubicundulus Ve08.2h10]
LFPKYPTLCQLLLKQTELFRSHYALPPEHEAKLIQHLKGGLTGEKVEVALVLTETHRLLQAQLMLQNHSVLINTYDECLSHQWPYDAPAKPQPLKPLMLYGKESQLHIMSKSSYMLVPRETKGQKKHKLDLSSGATASGSSGYSTEPIGALVEQEGSIATIKAMSGSLSSPACIPDMFM